MLQGSYNGIFGQFVDAVHVRRLGQYPVQSLLAAQNNSSLRGHCYSGDLGDVVHVRYVV